MAFSMQEIKDLINLVAQHKLEGVEIKTEEMQLKIKGQPVAHNTTVMAAPLPQMQAMPAVPSVAMSAPVSQEQETPAPVEATKPGRLVKSPIVGTFYSSPAPEKPAFVSVGQQVKKGDVLFIVESMKLMNEIESEFDGVVAEFLLEDGQSVEYGQPVMRIE